MTIKTLVAGFDNGDTIQVNLGGAPALRASAFIGAVMSYDAIFAQEVAKQAMLAEQRKAAAEAQVRQEQENPDGA